jgi:colanic acid/amylovoran biosynthesis glycosyltransferase
MNIAYFVNQYPKTSHSFIRREIIALEAANVSIHRFAIRSIAAEIVDKADKLEASKTQYVLQKGVFGLLGSTITVALTKPGRFFKALKLAYTVSRPCDRGLIYHLIYLAEASTLLRWFANANISHVHTHFGTNSATVAMLCRELGGPPYSMTVHGPEEFDKPQALSLTQKIERAAFVIAVCSFGRSQLYRWCSYQQWSKIHVVHCGVDAMFLKQPYTPLPAHPQFVCVGRLSEQKGHLLLIEAAGQLAAEGHKFKLVLVGDGPLRNRIEAMIYQFQLENHVEITGWATNEQVQQQILAAQVMVVPSFAEGLPVVIMESLALCRPVLSTYIAGIPELVQPGKSGWLVPSGSVDALKEAMQVAMQTPLDQLEEMGKTGAQLVAQNHNAEIEAKKLAALF